MGIQTAREWEKRRGLAEAREGLPPGLKDWDPNEHLLDGQRALDWKTQGLINEQLGRAFQPEDLIAREGLIGTDQYSPTSQGSESLKAKSMGSDPSTIEALEKRASGRHGDFMSAMKNDMDFKAVTQKADRLSGVASSLGRNEQLKLQNYKQKQLALETSRKLKEMRDAQRAGFLGDLLGVAIGGVGRLLTGGASNIVGAATGGAAGGAGIVNTDPSGMGDVGGYG